MFKPGDFAPGQLEAHYLKHGDQFGHITQEQYLQDGPGAFRCFTEGDVLEKIRHNGDVEHFRVSTGEFAVMTKRGRIRTYFKTDYGYWMTPMKKKYICPVCGFDGLKGSSFWP